MRRILFVLLVVLCCCFIGCGGSASVESDDSAEAEAEPAEDDIYMKLAKLDAIQSGETDMEKLQGRFKLFVLGISDKISDLEPEQVANGIIVQQGVLRDKCNLDVRLYELAYSMYNEAAMLPKPKTWELFAPAWFVRHVEISIINGEPSYSYRK